MGVVKVLPPGICQVGKKITMQSFQPTAQWYDRSFYDLLCITFRRACVCARWTLWNQTVLEWLWPRYEFWSSYHFRRCDPAHHGVKVPAQLSSRSRYEIVWVHRYDYEEVGATFPRRVPCWFRTWRRLYVSWAQSGWCWSFTTWSIPGAGVPVIGNSGHNSQNVSGKPNWPSPPE